MIDRKTESVDGGNGCYMKNFFTAPRTGQSTLFRNAVILTSFFNVQAPIKTPGYVKFKNLDYSKGVDISSSLNITYCDSICSQMPTCNGYVINSGRCYFKANFIYPLFGVMGITSLRSQASRQYSIQNGVLYSGTDMLYYYGSLNSCQQACDALLGCVGYVIYG